MERSLNGWSGWNSRRPGACAPMATLMDLVLTRIWCNRSGIFSYLTADGIKIAATLEHAYYDESYDLWRPKIPNGEYKCIRGMHQLAGMTAPFETFEIANVPGHSKILFHVGNFNKDSEGCVLLGENIQANMVTNSRESFEKFMKLQSDIDSFQLLVA